ncbi:MAG: hypothetical protein N2450_09550 [bacterium]|nr:hypothetical protein [bacterium]
MKYSNFVKDWKVRLIALLLGSVIWLVIISEEIAEKTITIPIIPYADKEDLIWTYPYPQNAVVRVQGKVRSIWWLEKVIRPKLKLPLSTLPDSGYVVLKVDMLELEGNVKLLSIVKPDSLPVKVEKRIVKILPIQPNLIIFPAEGFMVTNLPYALPSQVEVSGKKNEILKIQSIPTDTVVIQNATTSGQLKVKLKSPMGLTIGLKEVDVKYQVERIVEKSFDNVEVLVPQGWTAVPFWISFKIQGPSSEIANLQKRGIQAKISTPIVNTKVKPYLDIPPNCKIIEMKPEQVEIRRKE